MNTYQPSVLVSDAPSQQRADFIRRTYMHLAGAILAFIGLECLFFNTGLPEAMVGLLVKSQYSWLIVLGAFMLVSWVARGLAEAGVSRELQYVGLGTYVLAESIIFVPLLWFANKTCGPSTIGIAGIITGLLFGGLTFTAFTSGSDFSFMGGILKIGGFVALGVIVASIIFGFNLGVIFSAVMVLFAAGVILYNTGAVLHRYNTDQHVAASLSLFTAVALMFWYVLRILMRLRR